MENTKIVYVVRSIEKGIHLTKYQAAVYRFIEERNLVYVAYTRAKNYLGFITDYEQG